jgi:hypothetical protein
MPLYTFLHNLLNVLVETAKKGDYIEKCLSPLVARHQLGEHVSTAIVHAATEEMLDALFCIPKATTEARKSF